MRGARARRDRKKIMDTTNPVTTQSAAPISRSDAARLKQKFRGDLILPDDAAYAEARRVWNGMIDKHPAMIAYCGGATDVAAAIEFARGIFSPQCAAADTMWRACRFVTMGS